MSEKNGKMEEVREVLLELGVDAGMAQRLQDEGLSSLKMLSLLKPKDLVAVGMRTLAATALVNAAKERVAKAAPPVAPLELSSTSVRPTTQEILSPKAQRLLGEGHRPGSGVTVSKAAKVLGEDGGVASLWEDFFSRRSHSWNAQG
jgi:hypothetical protein